MIPVNDGTAIVFDFNCAMAVIDGSRVIQTALGRSRDECCRLDTICRSSPFSAPMSTSVGPLIAMSYCPLANDAMNSGRSCPSVTSICRPLRSNMPWVTAARTGSVLALGYSATRMRVSWFPPAAP